MTSYLIKKIVFFSIIESSQGIFGFLAPQHIRIRYSNVVPKFIENQILEKKVEDTYLLSK